MDLNTDTIKVALFAATPVVADTTYTVIAARISELASGDGYTTGGATVGGTGWTNSSGTSSLAANPTTWTSSTGNMGPFRYVVYYDSTTGDLIGWYDYGSAVTLNGVAGETFTVTPASTVLLTLA
jgi:hypothetical protein